LASGSPRRREILGGLGVPLFVLASDIPESREPEESIDGFLERIVRQKLDASLALAEPGSFAAALAADTVVVIDDELLGKPRDIPDAERLLSKLCGRTHTVTTRYWIRLPDGSGRGRTVTSHVELRAASDAEIAAYAATGEGLDKAGAYAAQGIGTFLVRGVRGSYTNVVGLPACEVIEDLCLLGLLPVFPVAGQSASVRGF
jgi:septum formation protein